MRALKLAYDSDITRNDKVRFYFMPALFAAIFVMIISTPRISMSWMQSIPANSGNTYIKTDYKSIPIPELTKTQTADLTKKVVAKYGKLNANSRLKDEILKLKVEYLFKEMDKSQNSMANPYVIPVSSYISNTKSKSSEAATLRRDYEISGSNHKIRAIVVDAKGKTKTQNIRISGKQIFDESNKNITNSVLKSKGKTRWYALPYSGKYRISVAEYDSRKASYQKRVKDGKKPIDSFNPKNYVVVGDFAFKTASLRQTRALLSTFWDAKFCIVFALIWAVIGFLYGRFKLYPLVLEKGYRARQYDEKNRFVNGLTQLLTAESRSVFDALNITRARSTGQFSKDLERFVYALRDANADDVVIIFNDFTKRYQDDLIFVQYMEQIRVTYMEGRNNIETIQQLKDWHGEVKMKQMDFMTQKNNIVLTAKLYYVVSLGIILMMHFMPMTWLEYVNSFSMTLVGPIVASITLSINLFLINKVVNTYYDSNVMSTAKG